MGKNIEAGELTLPQIQGETNGMLQAWHLDTKQISYTQNNHTPMHICRQSLWATQATFHQGFFFTSKEMPPLCREVWSRDAWASSGGSRSKASTQHHWIHAKWIWHKPSTHLPHPRLRHRAISAPHCTEAISVWGKGNAPPVNPLHANCRQSFCSIFLVST